MISGLLAIVILSLLVWNYLRNRWGGPQYPPGPPALPILGNLWTLKFQLHHDTLIQLAQVYGDVYTVWLGHTPVIVLNGYRAVREVLISHSEDFTGRPVLPLFMDLIGEKGVILTSGYTWKQQRRFALTTLRSLGLGKRRLEALIQEEAQSLLEQFAARGGTPMDLAASVTHSVSNIISLVVFGKRFLPGDRAFQELHTAAELVVAASGTLWARIYDLAPGLMRLLPGPHKKAFRYFHILCAFIQREIEQHRETLRGQPAAGQEMDVIDFYLTQICKTRGDLSSTYTEDNMVQLVADLFMAGTETVTTTLRWALLYMVAFPDIQGAAGAGRVTRSLTRDPLRGPGQAAVHERRDPRDPTLRKRRLGRDREAVREGDGAARVCGATGRHRAPQPVLCPVRPGVLGDAAGIQPQTLPGHGGELRGQGGVFTVLCSLLRRFSFRLPEGETQLRLDCVLAATLQPYPHQIRAVLRSPRRHVNSGEVGAGEPRTDL
ncbi:cytochrome P450 2J2-like isoform X4 [Ascaphus truei]|uniref:cytochrome P450 2J2-like isoform X4 n=1 Tax=Ascaphus truei TaxID=8439 RepID=UPI003F591564